MITNDEYLMTQDQIEVLEVIVSRMPLDGMLEAIGKAETLYMRGSDALSGVKKRVEALLAFQRICKTPVNG